MIALLAIAVVVLLLGWASVLQRQRVGSGRVQRGGPASKPDRIPAPIGNSSTFPAGAACPFALQTELVGGNQVLTFFDDGRFHATGRHLDLFTNTDSGASTRLDLQGSIDVVPTTDGGSILRGSGITSFVFLPGDAGPGDTQTGRTYLFTGHFVATSDPSGTITTLTSAGKSQDVCAMLAA